MSDELIRRASCTHCREQIPSALLEAHLRQVHGLRVNGGKVQSMRPSTFQIEARSTSRGVEAVRVEGIPVASNQPENGADRCRDIDAVKGSAEPPTLRAWSLGTTILPQGGRRCVCAFDAKGNVYYKALTVSRGEDVPPGTALSKKRGTDFKPTGEGVELGWAEAARRIATVWTVEPMTWKDYDGRELGKWCSSTIYPEALEWYPDGKYTPVAQRSWVPRRPGCWEEQFCRIDGAMPAQSTRIVELGFDLLREDHRDGYVYRSRPDARFRATWVVKYNGREGTDPPEQLPKGTVVGVFLAIGDWRARPWNPMSKRTEKFAFLKIGSVLSLPVLPAIDADDQHRASGELPAGAVRSYAQSARYAVGDIVRHPTFGDGEVRRVISRTRIDVLFGNELVMLAQGRQ